MSEEQKKSPEELAAEAKQKELVRAGARKFREEAKIAINSAGGNKSVEIALRYIMHLSGFHQNPRVLGADGDVKINSTIFNAGRESLYHDIRALMSVETKNLTERSE